MPRSDVAIFWDYENCPVPTGTSGYTVANSIAALSRPYGNVKLFRAYLEIADQLPLSRSVGLRSELQSSGVSLVDCPRNGRKEVADKMILVDMLAFAIDNPVPCTIVVITGDRDFAYALAVLKLRSYRMVLVTLPNAHTSLTAQASVSFNWPSSILKPPIITASPAPNPLPKQSDCRAASSREPQSPPEYVCRLPNPLSSTDAPEPDGITDIAYYLRKNTTSGLSSAHAASSKQKFKDIAPVSAARSPYISITPIVKFSSASTQTDLPSTTPLPLDITKPLQEYNEPPAPNSILSTSADGPQNSVDPHVSGEPSSRACSEARISSQATSDDCEVDVIESTSSHTSSSTHSPQPSPLSLLSPNEQSSPVWLNGAGWTIDTHSNDDFALSESDVVEEEEEEEDEVAGPGTLSSIQPSTPYLEEPTESPVQYTTPQSPHETLPKSPDSDVQVIHRDFFTLIKCLRMYAAQGFARLPMNQVLKEVAVQSTRKAIEKPNSAGFGDSVKLAVETGIIEMGGTGAHSWIGLNPGWHCAELVGIVKSMSAHLAFKSASSPKREKLSNSDLIEAPSPDADKVSRDLIGSFEPVNQEPIEQPDVSANDDTSGPSLQQNAHTDDPEPETDEPKPVGNSLCPEFKPSQVDDSQHVTKPAIASTSTDTLPTCPTATEAHKPALGLGTNTKRAYSPFETLPGCQVIPDEFKPLVLVLQELRKGGALWPSYSKVTLLVSECRDSDLFRRAGVQNFAQYVELATKEGIVEVMGQGDKMWMGLRLKWYDAVPSRNSLSSSLGRDNQAAQNDALLSLPSSEVVPQDNTPSETVGPAVTTIVEKPILLSVSIPAAHSPLSPQAAATYTRDESPANLKVEVEANKPEETEMRTLEVKESPSPTSKSVTYLEGLSSSEPSPSQQQTIPPQFVILVQTLQDHRRNGREHPLRGTVALQVAKGGTYQKAGVEKFAQYVDLAVKQGIVGLGGQGGYAWIGLRPGWYDAIPASALPSASPLIATSWQSPRSIPPNFVLLVRKLQQLRSEGIWKPTWVELAQGIMKSGVCQKSGVGKFGQYIALAVEQGIVESGKGTKLGHEWVRLLPDWYYAVAV